MEEIAVERFLDALDKPEMLLAIHQVRPASYPRLGHRKRSSDGVLANSRRPEAWNSEGQKSYRRRTSEHREKPAKSSRGTTEAQELNEVL